ncbi:MAG: YIP1 family protein [archaeon]|nr:YIP1 family protein [archaeon]MCP8306580.1 YIP1 family protein [archaeon]
MRLSDLLKNPIEFFENVRDEDWKPAFRFFLLITTILSILTPIVNYLGIESTDSSSSYQAQILAYRFLEGTLLTRYGTSSYLIEAFLIMGLALVILLLLTGFLHLVFRLMDGRGSVLNAWKAACYGVGPCILGGFLPYIALFAAFYSLILQLYIGPRVLYRVRESRAMIFLAIVLALTFIEMFLKGTTVGFVL